MKKKIGLVGFEPTASCTRGRRSTKLSHSPCQTAENLLRRNRPDVHGFPSREGRALEILPGELAGQEGLL